VPPSVEPVGPTTLSFQTRYTSLSVAVRLRHLTNDFGLVEGVRSNRIIPARRQRLVLPEHPVGKIICYRAKRKHSTVSIITLYIAAIISAYI